MEHERGVSEIVGAILLVALVILAMMIVAVALLSQPPPQEIPQVNALAGNNSDTIFIRHNGGDSLTPFETIVRIDGNPNPVPNNQILLRYENGTQTNWTTQDWSVGTTLVIPDTQTPTSVTLVYTGGSSQALLLTATFTETPPSMNPTLPPGSYHIIVSSAGNGGSISPSGSIQVPIGGLQAYTITPQPCYRITNVLVDGSSVGAVSSYTFSNVQADHTISATFALNDLAITATAGANGAISPIGTVSALCHGTQPFTITPSPGYYVQNVLVDGSSVGPVTTYTFSDIVVNHTISASFSSSPPYCTPVVVSFTAVPTNGAIPLLVTFTDTSTGYPDSWQWDFGDGSANSTLRNPTYTYTAGGTYSVTLTATNTSCGTSGSRTVTDLINATSPGPVCGTISGYKWNDLNGNGVWNSGEPGLSGWVINVSEKQGNRWNYLATTVTNSSGYYIFTGLTYHPASDYLVQETLQTGWQETYPATTSWEVHLEPPGPGSVGVPPKCYATGVNFGNRQVAPPGVNFVGTPTSGNAPLTVQFTDQSTGNPTQWAWDFNNDGTTDSTLQNPFYIYSTPGTYSVKLTATTAGGSATIIKTGYITVSGQSFDNFIIDDNVFIYGNRLIFEGDSISGPGATVIVNGGLNTADLNGGASVAVTTIYIDGNVNLDGGSASLGSASNPGSINVNGDLTLGSGSRNIYGNVYVAGDFFLKHARIHNNVYVNGDLSLDYTPTLDTNTRIYYTGGITYPHGNYPQNILDKCIHQTSVPGFTIPDEPLPPVKSADWYSSRGYVSGGTLTSNLKIFADSYSSTSSYTSAAYNVIIIARNGDITLTRIGTMTGVLFAPRGKVTFDGGSFEGVVITRDGFFVTSGGTDVTFRNFANYFSGPDNYPF